jgi:hypothetical protein
MMSLAAVAGLSISATFGLDSMPRYHLNLAGPRTVVPDEEGAEFESLEHAYLEAFKGARDLWRELLLRRQDPRAFSFEITDVSGSPLMTVPLSEVLDTCRPARAEPGLDPASPRAGVKPSPSRAAVAMTYHEVVDSFGRVQQKSAELREQVEMTRATLERTRRLIQTKGPSDLW